MAEQWTDVGGDEAFEGASAEVLDLAWMCLAGTEPGRARRLLARRLEQWPEAEWAYPGVVARAAMAESGEPEEEQGEEGRVFWKRFWGAAAGYFEREVNRFDPRADGLARWPDEEEPFALDAAVVLAEEARAYLGLMRRREELLPQADFAHSTLNDVEGWIPQAVWDEDGMRFLRRAGADGEPMVDGTERPLWALAWKSAGAEMVDAVMGIRPAAADGTDEAEGTPLRLLLAAWLLGEGAEGCRYRRVVGELLGMELPAGEGPRERAWREIGRSLRCQVPGAKGWERQDELDLRRKWGVAAVAGAVVLVVAATVSIGFGRGRSGEPLETVQLARQAAEEGEVRRAAELFEAAAEKAETEGERRMLLFQRANCLLKGGEVAWAEAAYRALLADYPDWGEAQFNLGCALLAAGHAEEATEVFEEVGGATGASADLKDRGRAAATFLKTRAK